MRHKGRGGNQSISDRTFVIFNAIFRFCFSDLRKLQGVVESRLEPGTKAVGKTGFQRNNASTESHLRLGTGILLRRGFCNRVYLVTFSLGCKKIFEESHGKFNETPESPTNPPYLNKTRNLHLMFGGYLIFDEAPLKLSLRECPPTSPVRRSGVG